MVSGEALNEKMETSEESSVMGVRDGEIIKVEIEMEDEQERLEAKDSSLSSNFDNQKSDIANTKVNEKYR